MGHDDEVPLLRGPVVAGKLHACTAKYLGAVEAGRNKDLLEQVENGVEVAAAGDRAAAAGVDLPAGELFSGLRVAY